MILHRINCQSQIDRKLKNIGIKFDITCLILISLYVKNNVSLRKKRLNKMILLFLLIIIL